MPVREDTYPLVHSKTQKCNFSIRDYRKILPYKLRIKNLLQLPNTRTKKYGNESLSFRGSIIWNQLPDRYKAAKNDNEFKMKSKVGRDLNVIAASVSSFLLILFILVILENISSVV